MFQPPHRFIGAILLVVALGGAAACQRAYYSVMERFGVPKREILVNRVVEARDAQEEARERFQSALERFQTVLGFDGGELEDKYNALNAELKRSESRASAVHDRIDAVRDVAGALFAEWEDELDQYENADLRRRSERQLKETRDRYQQLITAMERAESRIEPVLKPLRDQVLFLKHNLNARAIASLQEDLGEIQTDVDALIRELERAIAEADAFIQQMETAE
ncbi:MAG TPA: DUF2959 domain-containing protein [Candidatus Sumerlaeota bacterium]|mgnify:CR=1 FL=1|nr:DUF2959 domain-containing protein [Candidatus Sumerlaeota bacterium]HOR27496.1 DUF2959 domain-containing protein [Candidatus Sumerlaeota bacterium]HPK01006.1 DUF2959 domain-containing protein [Candidatus Sumerlaeota bacterium]